MVTFPAIAKSFGRHFFKKTYFYDQLLGYSSQKWRLLSIRTLILQSETESEFVKLIRGSDSDAGTVEVNMDRPETNNAIGKEMLRGLHNSIEAVYRDSSVNVLMISSLVPRAFCAGADLKERKMMTASEVQDFVNSLRSTFAFLEVYPHLLPLCFHNYLSYQF